MADVTIGMPVYNGANFIAEAIESLLAQTFTDFELIISDNGSTDETESICRSFVKRDPRVQYFRSDCNRGAAWNYNRTFELSNSPYFKWASHDDICAPTLVERCVEVLDQEDAVVLCYAKTTFIDEKSQVINEYEDKLNLGATKPHRRFWGFLRKPAGCNPVFGLMRRDVLATTRLIGSYESSDYNLLAEMCLRGQFRELPERLFYRRNHPLMSRRVNKSGGDFISWFNTNCRGRNRLPHLRILYELIKRIWQAPINDREKLLCYGEIVRTSLTLGNRTFDWCRARNDKERMY